MTDFEQLGTFYLGRQYDLAGHRATDTLTLYDSKDLTTHAVIIGMTGSGKTGLGIGFIEEAALDRVPVIAVDPKGDLGNLLLTFSELRPTDFRPWVDAQEAARLGISLDDFAAREAERWRKGLAEWGQSPERIARLRQSAEFQIFTPGSSAGLPISVLRAFAAPAAALRQDADRYLEHITATATSLLALLGIEGDPVRSREHILLASLLRDAWDAGRDVDLGALIAGIQTPPFTRLGVMDVESVFPAADRVKLATQLNNLLASPGFEAWRQGMPLDAARLLYTDSGAPRVSVISIAHLSDAERMFFVSMLLAELVNWMRAQPGTGSLRAILYMDEVMGYLPPVANPPSKPLFLTLLKQARAFGLGLVLATQNPVDLDYKALANAGTWLLGRLQTERDKARVMDGLEGIAAGGRAKFDRSAVETLIAGLDKRVFYLHDVHEDEPAVFMTRWTMSYLAGPMTREQIRSVMAGRGAEVGGLQPAPVATPAAAAPVQAATPGARTAGAVVILPPSVRQFVVPPAGGVAPAGLEYVAQALGAADVAFTNARYGVNVVRRVVHACAIADGPIPVEWERSRALDVSLDALGPAPPSGAPLVPPPGGTTTETAVASWTKSYERWLRASQQLVLKRSPTLEMVSGPDESEGAFRARLQDVARERRDARTEALRKKYAPRIAAVADRLARAEQGVAREKDQATAQQVSTAAHVGTAILGALFGRKGLSVATASRVGTAIRGAGRVYDEAGDVRRARATVDRVRQQLDDLEQELQTELAAQGAAFDAQQERLQDIPVRAVTSGVQVHFVGVGWVPFVRQADGTREPAVSATS